MSAVGVSLDPEKIWRALRQVWTKSWACLTKVDDVSINDVAESIGLREAHPVRDDRWTVTQTSLRGGGYTRFTVFFRSESGMSLVGTASVDGKQGSTGDKATVNLVVLVDLDIREIIWPVDVEILVDGSDSGVEQRKSKVLVDGELVLEWKWCRSATNQSVRGRVFRGDESAIWPVMKNLEYKRALDSTKMRFEWEDKVTGDDFSRKTCIETTGKGLYEAYHSLLGRIEQSTRSRRWNG